MSKGYKLWTASIAAVLAVFIITALFLPRSFGLTAFSDLVQCLLLVSGTAAFIPLALRSHGRIRLFWSLVILSTFSWFCYQLFWTYYEVALRKDVPELCTWDIVLFLHLVPLMAGLALRPHVPRDEYASRVGRLDFALLIVWWLYVYVLIVLPWQYVIPDIPAYNRNLNNVYLVEKLVLLSGLIASWMTSKGAWRRFYASLFAATLCYSSGSTFANWAIARNAYYSGSLYDLPLVSSMAFVTWIGLCAKAEKPAAQAREASTSYGVWVARCSMISVFSLPLFAAWAMSDSDVPVPIRVFRVTLTLLAAFGMGVMVFVRQRTLDRELIRLLGYSRESFDNLKRLQSQILQSEKLASVGQLVGGAAHELNNPITAMLGYSDLLLSTGLTAEQRPLAAKIGQHVRRTKSLVAGLISFARQAPAPKSPIDLNTLARTAVKLTQPQWEALDVEIRTQFQSSLPKVLGDSNQLLQVCLQLLANSLHSLNEKTGRIVTVSTELQAGVCVLQISTASAEPAPEAASASTSMLDPEEGLGLSACHGILQEHRGRMSRESSNDGTVLLRVELPASDPAAEMTMDPTSPVQWQSQPYA